MENLINEYKKLSGYEKNRVLSEIIKNVENNIDYFLIKYKNIGIDSEDLKSELLIETYKACDRYISSKEISFKTYLSKCLNNKCLKIYRDSRSSKRVLKNDNEVIYNVSIDKLKEECECLELSCKCTEYEEVEIKMLLDYLDLDKDEKIICNGYIEGYSKSEIACLLKVSNGTVTYKTKKIREKLKKELKFI